MTHKVEVIDFAHLDRLHIQGVFGVTRQAVDQWVAQGCPVNMDGTMSAPLVIKWYNAREDERRTRASGKDRKIELECERLEAQIAKIKDESIERTMHEQILVSRAATLRQFVEKTVMMNCSKFVGLDLDQAQVYLFEIFKRALNEYAGSDTK